MAAATQLQLEFADGEYIFRLGLAQIREIQRAVGEHSNRGVEVGIGVIYARILAGRFGDNMSDGSLLAAQFHIDDNREVVRHALIGGNYGFVDGDDKTVSPVRAKQLIEAHFDTMPVKEQWDLGAAIAYSLMEGYSDEETRRDDKDDPEGKKKAATSTTPQP